MILIWVQRHVRKSKRQNVCRVSLDESLMFTFRPSLPHTQIFHRGPEIGVRCYFTITLRNFFVPLLLIGRSCGD